MIAWIKSWQTKVFRSNKSTLNSANILRLGRDILYLDSDSGNGLGAKWLSHFLGHDYRVHAVDNVYSGTHIDTTIAIVRPGLVVVIAERVTPENLPALFAGWDVIYLQDVVDIGYTNNAYASKWIGISFLMVSTDSDGLRTTAKRTPAPLPAARHGPTLYS